MSAARHLHTPPDRRAEVDVAADAIVAILDARIVPFTSGMIGRLSMATGVPVADIERAWRLKESGYRVPLPTRRPIEDSDPITPNPPPAAAQRKPPQRKQPLARTVAAYPEPGKRRCAKCETVKPVEDFDWKDRAKGYRRAWCHECYKAYQRSRWLTVEQSKRLTTLLRFVVCEEDHLEADCVTCHLPIKVGQEVVADDVKLSHATCSAE